MAGLRATRLRLGMLFILCTVQIYDKEIYIKTPQICNEKIQIDVAHASLHEKHGTVVSSIPCKGGIRESVVIYPQQAHDSSETIHRNGFLTRYKNARATVLICHGFMCDKYDVGVLRSLLFEPGQFNVMTFDFRGHGENVCGQYCTLGKDEALDVIAAAQFLRSHKDLQGKPLFVYGFSMGAVASIEAQSREKLFDAMILDCPFDSSEKVIKNNLRHLKFSIWGYECEFPGVQLMQKYAFHPYVQLMIKTLLKTVSQLDANHVQTNICPSHPAESAKKITVPCFFIHCKNDQKVSVDQVMAVYKSIGGYKRLWLTNGRRHFDSFFYDPDKYIEQVRAFCVDVLRKRYQKADQAKIIEDKEINEFVLPASAA